jgi:secreted Zn-dependent insulinase-like peptidase
MGPPYQKFSTGNIGTLRDAPLEAGLQVERLLREYWERRYTAGEC